METHIQVLKLTGRQKEIILLTCNGKTNRQISKLLFIAEKTVYAHKYAIMRNLEARSMCQVIAMCFRQKLID